mgnify:CR=1 FL=1
MNRKTKEIYSEVYQVLNFLGNEYIDKLPKSLVNMLEQKRDINYEPKYTEDIPLNKQNIKKETISIIALLHLNYWCENENEKFELKQIFKNNEDMYENELRKKYNPDNIFKKHVQEKIIKNEVALVEYKESIFKRLINKIKSLFI